MAILGLPLFRHQKGIIRREAATCNICYYLEIKLNIIAVSARLNRKIVADAAAMLGCETLRNNFNCLHIIGQWEARKPSYWLIAEIRKTYSGIRPWSRRNIHP